MREMLNWGECGRRFKDYHLLEKMDVHTLVYYGDPAGAKRLGEHFPMLSVLLFSGKGGAEESKRSIFWLNHCNVR